MAYDICHMSYVHVFISNTCVRMRIYINIHSHVTRSPQRETATHIRPRMRRMVNLSSRCS